MTQDDPGDYTHYENPSNEQVVRIIDGATEYSDANHEDLIKTH